MFRNACRWCVGLLVVCAGLGCGGGGHSGEDRGAPSGITSQSGQISKSSVVVSRNDPNAPLPVVTPAVSSKAPQVPKDLKRTPTGLQYAVTREGTGVQPQVGQTVLIHYVGYLPDGKKFDASKLGRPLRFKLGADQAVDGMDEGVAMLKVGSQAWLVLPPALGYGEQGSPPAVPPNTVLTFFVELAGVE